MDAERLVGWDEGMVSFWLDGQTKVNNVDIARRDALALAVMAHAQHAEVARLSAEREELESLRKTDAAALRGVGAQVMRLKSELAHARAVIEEAQAFEMQFTEMKMPEIRALDAILDRGLKGETNG